MLGVCTIGQLSFFAQSAKNEIVCADIVIARAYSGDRGQRSATTAIAVGDHVFSRA